MLKNYPELKKRLLGYSAMASLAAAGTLAAGAAPAQAADTSRVINCTMSGAGQFCNIDFDNDGNNEFRLLLSTSYPNDLFLTALSNSGDVGKSFVQSGVGYSYPAVLSFGSLLGSGRTDWVNSGYPLLYSSSSGNGYGNWGAPKGHATDPTQGVYVGVSFQLAGSGTHYGWIELYIPTNGNVTVRRIGYDDVAGGSIPSAVHLSGAEASSSSPIAATGAAAFTALAGLLTWLRLRIKRQMAETGE